MEISSSDSLSIWHEWRKCINWKRLSFGIASLATIGLLAACSPAATSTPTRGVTPTTAAATPTTAAAATATPTRPAATATPTTAVATPTPTTPAPTATPTPTPVVSTKDQLVIALNEQNSSNQSGVAVLVAKGATTEVTVTLRPGPTGAGVTQPIHIHVGTCATLGGVSKPLTVLTDGKSTSTVDVTLTSLLTGGFEINAHKSSAEASVYTACGDIPTAANFVTIALKNNGPAATAQSGWATVINDGANSTRVNLMIAPAAANTQPVHVHNSTCATLGGVLHPLTAVSTLGISTTTLAVPWAQVLTGATAINSHKSSAEASIYTSCGDLPKA